MGMNVKQETSVENDGTLDYQFRNAFLSLGCTQLS